MAAEVGQRVWIDDGAAFLLEPCDDWDKAEFRVEAGGLLATMVAVNVRITGRKVHRNWGAKRIRCKIEFVGDCEPSTFEGAWLYV